MKKSKDKKEVIRIIDSRRKVICGYTINNNREFPNFYIITELDKSKQYFYQIVRAKDGTLTDIPREEKPKLRKVQSISWYNTPVEIRKSHCYSLLGYRVSEKLRNLFIFGSETVPEI